MTELETKVRTAAAAGWWTLLIAVAVFLIQWVGYLLLVPARPDWVLALWGPGASWPEVQNVWFWTLAGFKLFLVVVALVLLWLTLWAARLRREL